MAIDITNIVSVQPPTPAPQSQGTQGASSAPENASNAQQGAPSQGQNAGDNAAGNNNANASDGHFSKLLGAQGQNGNQANAKPASPVPPAGNTNNSTATVAALPANAAGNTNVATIALLLSQLQAGGSPANGNSSPASSVSSDTLAQLQQLVQKLLHLSEQSTGAAANSTAVSSDSAAPAAPENPKAGGTDSQTTDNSAAAQLLAQLAALLQQITQQANSAPVAASGSATDDGTISSNAGGNPEAALLAQLASLLGQKPGGAQATGTAGTDGKSSASGNSGKNASDASASSASFDATLSALLQSPDTKSSLESALSQINNFLSLTQNPKGDTTKDSSLATATSNAATTSAPATQLLSAATSNPQPVTNSGFAKLVSASAQPPSVADQVLVQIKNAADSSSQIKIQLEPADLGKVTVQMTTGTDGKTGVTVTADNRTTLSLLQSEARSLESALRDIGLKTGSGGLSFNLSGQQNQQQTPGNQGGYTQVAPTATDEDADYYGTATQVYQIAARQGLDIRV